MIDPDMPEHIFAGSYATGKQDWAFSPDLINLLKFSECFNGAYYTKNQSEKLAKFMIEHGFSTGHGDTIDDLLKELDWQLKEMKK